MPPPVTAEKLIAALNLTPLPGEGGFFRPTWRNATASAIYFLITPESFSALHSIAQDEVWHFHAGETVDHVQIDPTTGTLRRLWLGPEVSAGEVPQLVVPAGTWQGARLASPARPPAHGFALLGCTVSPPWDEAGFRLGRRDELEHAFPSHAELICALTR